MSDFGLDASERWLADWSASIDERAVQAQRLAAEVARLSATASTDDGDVTVIVGSSGQVIDLTLSERTRAMSAADLSRLILLTIRRAQARLPELAAQVARETVGGDSSAAQAVVAAFERRFPPVPDDADRPT